MKPTVGRIVHYMSGGSPILEDGTQKYPSECRAAIITGITRSASGREYLSLTVFNPEGLHFIHGRSYDETGQHAMSWHWPERESTSEC